MQSNTISSRILHYKGDGGSQNDAVMSKFRELLQKARRLVIITGAGVSAESGVPTFRGSGGLWRQYRATDLATMDAFKRSPSLVWEFYHYRRELVLTKHPNEAHLAIARCEEQLTKEGRSLTLITQNVDGLHQRAGSKNVLELHGSLYQTKCLKCGDVNDNRDSPICPALAGCGVGTGRNLCILAPDGKTKKQFT